MLSSSGDLSAALERGDYHCQSVEISVPSHLAQSLTPAVLVFHNAC